MRTPLFKVNIQEEWRSDQGCYGPDGISLGDKIVRAIVSPSTMMVPPKIAEPGISRDESPLDSDGQYVALLNQQNQSHRQMKPHFASKLAKRIMRSFAVLTSTPANIACSSLNREHPMRWHQTKETDY